MCALRRVPPSADEIPRRYEKSLGGLQLHLDDLEDLHELLKSRTTRVQIVAGDAIAETVDDLRGATREELCKVRFVTEGPTVEVRLGEEAKVSTSTGESGAWELVHEVHALAERRKAPRLYLRNCLVIAAPFVVLGILAAFKDGATEWMTRWPAVVLAVLGLVGYQALEFRRHRWNASAVVLPYRRSEVRTLGLQSSVSSRASVKAGVILGCVGIPVAVAVAWVTDLLGLKN